MQKLLYNIIPSSFKNKIDQYRKQWNNYKILTRDYGQFRSIQEGKSLDSSGKPIPWYTYPAIEYLDHLDLSQMNVFEFGSGNSTLWWARKANSVTSVEDDENWYKRVLNSEEFSVDNTRYMHAQNKDKYIKAFMGNFYEIIIIDGKYRAECANLVLRSCRNNVVILIFDNSDWYPETINNLQKCLGWIQVDFHGFGPVNNYTWTTTVFINHINLSRLRYIAPLKSIAGIDINADN